VLIDESGLLMAPLLRRTWAPRGKTPILYQCTRSYKKVSAIAALCLTPDQKKIHLYFRLHVNASIKAMVVKAFLKLLFRQIHHHPLIIVWDRLKAHRAKIVQRLFSKKLNRYNYFFPPYAPELNPVEYVWEYLKMNQLVNMPSCDVLDLAKLARKSGRSLRYKQNLLHAFLKHSSLF
jgi:transposase